MRGCDGRGAEEGATRGGVERLALPRVLAGRGCWVGGMLWFDYTARPPPPVILPGAAGASHCLAGAFAPGFAVPARAAACCLIGGVSVPHFYAPGYEWRGAEKGAMWGGVDAACANPQDSSHRGLAHATRLGLRGLRLQAPPATFASRAVRRSPASRLFPRPGRPRARPSRAVVRSCGGWLGNLRRGLCLVDV